MRGCKECEKKDDAIHELIGMYMILYNTMFKRLDKR